MKFLYFFIFSILVYYLLYIPHNPPRTFADKKKNIKFFQKHYFSILFAISKNSHALKFEDKKNTILLCFSILKFFTDFSVENRKN